MAEDPVSTLRVSEAERLIENLIKPGRIVAVDCEHKTATVRVGGTEEGTYFDTAPLRWLTERAGKNCDWDPPEVGEQVLLLSPSGDPAQGWILRGAYRDLFETAWDKPYIKGYRHEDGAVIFYDRKAHTLSAILPEGSSATVRADHVLADCYDCTIHAPDGITLDGPVEITKTLHVHQTIHADDDIVAETVSLEHHLQTGVLSGGELSGEPLQ